MKRVLWCIALLSSLSAQEVCIENFDSAVCGNFRILNSIILRSTLSKTALEKRLNKPVKVIAFLEDSNLYVIDSDHPLQEAKTLKNRAYIIYAQPNILQKRHLSFGHESNITTQYNLQKEWKKSLGEGIKIAIIDDGFNLNHPDLKGLHVSFSYDVDQKSLNADPKVKIDHHGTEVAGIIFARHNGIGIDGIAPNAELIAIRQTTNITSDTIVAFSVADKAGADIINCSWNSPLLLEPVYDVITAVAKKRAIVFAAGNDAQELKPLCIEAAIPEVITVGATQQYSNYGALVDIILKSGVRTTTLHNTYAVFGGTSATAAVVSGLLALKMSQNRTASIEMNVDSLKKEINGI